ALSCDLVPQAVEAEPTVPVTPAVKDGIQGAILPLDLLVEVLSYLTPNDAWLAVQVCQWWQQLLARDDGLRVQVAKNGKLDMSHNNEHVRRERLKAGWAFDRGYAAVLRWAIGHGYYWSDYGDPLICASVARAGHFEALEVVRSFYLDQPFLHLGNGTGFIFLSV